ncbi:carcinoembryonic antigen-related cell adhesion molecule 1-like [Sparus aurata]|uniref:carcinoembryonic antigen-related cell adhesion molecule 1-like n=1 Tax=Sparus aurata TaxID=8175 RepID=UPI0011C13238|nr:carcinoembryonic antigen-related cell adhesion molecule 1-like [Sparus aurata]
MAAVAELSFLLFALINNIHAEERIIIANESDSFTYSLPEEADSCLISRFVGEEMLVLWNTSALWSQNSTAPEDLKQRLSVVSRDNISSYMIQNLTHSDSGQYQEKCWGNVTYERNITIIVCSMINRRKHIQVTGGETVDLPCEGAADNLDIQWLKSDSEYEDEIWTRVFGDSVTSVMDDVEGRSQEVKTSSGLRIYNLTLTRIKYYNCLLMNQQQCVSSHPVELDLPFELILHTVGETAVLQCPAAEFTDNQPPVWKKFSGTSYNSEVGKNYSLVLSSLQLNHSNFYSCQIYNHVQWYHLVVCPKSGPPAVELFSEGDNVTFRCRGWEEGRRPHWFIKSNQTEDRFLYLYDSTSHLKSRLNISKDDGLLILSNVSLEDTGEYWCVVYGPDTQCVSSSRTVLKSREPSGMDFTLYTVRSSLLPGLLVILCVVVVAVNQRTRRGEQRPAQTDS